MNRLISITLVCLLHLSLAVASTFSLRVEVTPGGSGSLNTNSGTYEEGSNIYLRTYANTGYVFKGWYEGEAMLSSSASFNYTMPSKDALVQARYEYDPTVPGNPAMPDTTTYYTLTATVSPAGAGSLNTYNGRYAAGATVNMRTYGNTGYQFVGWQNSGGETVSTSSSFNYTMPRSDAQLTALYVYDPIVPANPDSMATRYTVNVACKPVGGGTFNTTSATAEEGGNVHLYAYTNTGYRFLRWENEAGETVSTAQSFYYVMPHGGAKLYGIFEFDPAVPGNPSKNYWNKELGEVIVDDFTPGGLGSAVSSAINGSNRSDVAMITVAGRMNDNDFGIANDYTNCTLLDLSRVTGIAEVPSYAFDYTNLESVCLPATIEKMGYRAFYECRQLSSLIVYAMTPPTLENNVFTGVPEGLVVYVPAAAIAQYQESAGWKDFTILPIQEDIRSISVSMPDGANAADYAQMWLELANTKSGQRMHYVMTGRRQYTFGNIIRNTSWNVTLRNERGDVFGRIDNVEVKDEDVAVVFSTLMKPQQVSLVVQTPDGQDVTTQTQITWTDAQGSYVAQGASLTGLPVGYQASYRVVLSQELAMLYDTPQAVEYVLKDGGNDIVCQLEAIKQLQISGKVKDAATGLPLSGATVSASQTFGGKYSKTLNAKTDNNGVFTMTIANVPTSVAFAASDYVSQTVVFNNNEFDELNEFAVPDVSLKSITGATINLGFTYTPVEGEAENWYSDYQNVSYTLYNITREKPISQFNVQYPQIVLLEEIEDGDVLRLSATSRTNAFMPVETTAVIAAQKAEATFDIVELGQIRSTFTTTGNASVVGSLYDAAGKLVNTCDYANASLTISNLADGSYMLVTMGSSRLFNTIYDLAQLPQTGLVEGSDYVLNTVEVKSGQVSAINISEVPTLDESKLYYTGDNTSFTVNKPSIVAGNYLTLTGRIDFKLAYAASVSNVQMIVDLPESCEFVENSVMVGNSTSSYTLSGNRITIPMTRYTDRVRFCVIPTLGGEYAPSAFAQFDIDGETVTQPIGSANYTAKDLSINVPSTVAKTTVSISGTAIGTSSIDIYDNEVLIGQTTSLANGNWRVSCELNEPYNLSKHSIYAKVTTKAGMELQSETVECVYDMNAVEVRSVTMINTAHPASSLNTCEYITVFDFQNPPTSIPAYWYWPEYPDFTFLVDFTNNDTTIVKNVVLYVFTDDDKVIPLYPEYDANKDKFIATAKFNSYSLPCNVSVDYDAYSEGILSREFLKENYLDTEKEYAKERIASVETLIQELYNTEDEESYNNLNAQINGILGISSNNDYSFSSLNDYYKDLQQSISESASLIERIDTVGLLNTIDIDIYNEFNLSEWGENIIIGVENITDVSIDSLISRGYELVKVDDGSSVYVLATDSAFIYVDIAEGVQYTLKLYETDVHTRHRIKRAASVDVLMEYISSISSKIESGKKAIDKLVDGIGKCNKRFSELFGEIENQIATNEELLKIWQYNAKNLIDPEDANVWEQEIPRLQNELKILKIKLNTLLYVRPILRRTLKAVTSLYSLINHWNECITDVKDYVNLWNNVPECPCDPFQSTELKAEIIGYGAIRGGIHVFNIASDIASIYSAIAGTVSAPATGGSSLSVVLTTIGVIIVKEAVKYGLSYHNKWRKSRFRSDINKLANNQYCYECNPPTQPTQPTPPTPPTPPCPSVPNVKDPSGYVYEGVASNRIEGVTATAYYKEMVEDMYGDLHENIVKWDAAEYAQENPLFTDEYGMYAWDVPNGLWQVKFEKEGYETTYSEWLPVPPPQLDVNIPMKQNVQPNVKLARAYEDAVEVEFDKYMMPGLLTTDNIMVMQSGMAVEGTVELLNEETSYEGAAETFASKVRFSAAEPFTEQEVTLLVSNRVKSYAGIRMQDDYQQTFTVEQEVKQIVCDSALTVAYGGQTVVCVEVRPAAAAKGKTLNMVSSSNMILGVETDNAVIGEDGKASFTVSGELPGSAALTFTLDGYDLKATTIINVDLDFGKPTAAPVASIASGSLVEAGTAVTLSCATKGATIYYTLDGSCPCNEASRMVYDGTPIVLDRNLVIKAMAVAPNMEESEIVSAVYIILRGDVNNDKKVGIGDIVAVTSHVAGNTSIPAEIADVNGDGKVGIGDVIAITNIVAGSTHASPKHKTYFVNRQ